jgi:hypothetical protein
LSEREDFDYVSVHLSPGVLSGQAVEDEVVKRAAPAGDAAHIFLALWGVTAAGAGRHVA